MTTLSHLTIERIPAIGHAPSAANEGLPQPARAIAVACVLSAMALVVLDASIVTVALPTIARSLRVAPADSILVVSVYQLALLMALLPCAALGQSLGLRCLFTVGVALFIGASAMCVIAPGLPWLIASRFLQGLGGAAILSLGMALLRFAVSDRRLGAAIGWNALTVALCSAAGPTLGAAILWGAGWPWLFAVNIPIGAMSLLATWALPVVPGSGRLPDRGGVALFVAAIALLYVGVESLAAASAVAVALFCAAVPVAILLARRERQAAAALLPLDLLRDRSFRIAVIASICCFTGQTAALVALPFYLHHSLGQTAATAGLFMTPWPLAVVATAPLAGRLADRVSTGLICAAGGGCLAIGLAAAALWPLDGNPLPLVPLTMLCGVGFGLFQVANNRTMFLAAPRARSAAAGGMQGTARLSGQIGGALAMTLLLGLISIDRAPRMGLALGALFTLAAGLVSLLRTGSSVLPALPSVDKGR